MAKTKKADSVVDVDTNLVDTTTTDQNASDETIEKPKTIDTLAVTIPKPTLEVKKEWVFNPNEKTNVRNITNIGISVILENTVGKRGEVFIPAKQARPINNEEIIIKVEAQNPSFCGTDGLGTNASLFIEDVGFRQYLDFETEEYEQSVLSDELLEEIFDTDKLAAFKKIIQEHVKTYVEKDKLISYLREKYSSGDFDSASKIDFVEKHTGLKIKE